MCVPLSDEHIFRSIEVSIPACHAGDPGSIPGGREFVPWEPTILKLQFLYFIGMETIRRSGKREDATPRVPT